MSTSTAADEFKLKFYEATRDLMAEDPDTQYVMVTYGMPGTFEPDDLVSILDVKADQEPMTMGNRGREETLTLRVEISCFRGGGAEQELVCAQRAYQILRMIEHYFRKTDTTVGGTVRHCFLEGHDSQGQSDPQLLDKGRVIEISARFLAQARIT